jgi:hypothetical protein
MNKEKFYVISGCNCHTEYSEGDNIKCLIPVQEIQVKKELIEDSIKFINNWGDLPEVTFTMRFYFYIGKDEDEYFDASIHNEVLDKAESGQIVEMFYGDIFEDIQGGDEGIVTVDFTGSINFKKIDDMNGDEYFTEHHTTIEMILKD